MASIADLVRDIAQSKAIARIHISGAYYDSAKKQERLFDRTFTRQQILDGRFSFPENLNEEISIAGVIAVTPMQTASIPDRLDELREREGLTPLPFRWLCEKTTMVPGGVQYLCRQGESRQPPAAP